MGNFSTTEIPQKGQIGTVVESPYTVEKNIPGSSFGKGMKVKIHGSTKLLCSRPTAPPVFVTLVRTQDGSDEVYPSLNIK